MATLGNLPDELMIEILSRLPPESLLRFKSVQKSWYALINDSKFATKHFSNSLHHNHLLLKRVITNGTGVMDSIFSILQFPFSDVRSESICAFRNLRPFSRIDFVHFEICGHSHGLLCLSNIGKDIFLCNPATREIRKLPSSILHLTEPPEDPDGYDSLTNAVGFGYDPRSKDFKVVRVVGFREGGSYVYPKRVEIYDLRKDRWREIESPACGNVFWPPVFEMNQEGTYYWWAHDKDGGQEIIQTFDMTHEVFGRISLPEGYRDNDSSLGVLNGSIVLFYYPLSGPPEKTFDVWEMEEDETGSVSWSKVFTIGPISGIEKPLLFVSSDELLMEASEGQVIMYNIRTQQLKELHIKGHPRKFRAIFFVKSLVSVKGGSHV